MDTASSPNERPAPQACWKDLIHHKGNISPTALSALCLVGGLPLVMVFARALALPGVDPLPIPGMTLLHDLGVALNQWMSLAWVPPGDRPEILYLLLIPTGALLVVIARLVLGLRVLGLRAILLAIGFQHSGFLPSLILIGIVVATIVAIRPSMRRIKLPLYARLSVILCFAALIMIAALLIAPWVRSEAVWGVAFFPVIIVAMLAEGIAKTIASDNTVLAIWRAGWTLLLAIIIALVGQFGPVRETAILFPELMVTQLVAIVFIAEFLDLRLMEDWPTRLHRSLVENKSWEDEKPRVAVVRNRWNTNVIGRLNRPAPSQYRKHSVQKIVDGLREIGYKVRVFEGDLTLFHELSAFIPPDTRSGRPSGMVLNLSSGTQGNGRFSQVPGMLELAGIAYTGPDPIAQARLADRLVLLTLLRQAGIPVPRFVATDSVDSLQDPLFPVQIGPRCEPDAPRDVVSDADNLRRAVDATRRNYEQQSVIEELVVGREIQVTIIGNAELECLPLIESIDGRLREADLDSALAERVCQSAITAFRAAGCRDYARIDLSIPPDGTPQVVDVRWVGVLGKRGSSVKAAALAGYDMAHLVGRIIEVAAVRYEAMTVPLPAAEARSEIVPISRRKQTARRQAGANR